jgi:hypothetical protein
LEKTGEYGVKTGTASEEREFVMYQEEDDYQHVRQPVTNGSNVI